jgi:tetratricopeptide (TPR) repeat protein
MACSWASPATSRAASSSSGYKKADAWVNLGWVYRNMNKPEESIAAYRKALQIDPKQEQASLGLGWAYQQTKAYDQAIAAYQQAVQTNPDLAGNAYTGVSWCYFFKQDLARAKEFQAKAEQGGGKDSRLGEWIAKLEQGLIKSQAEVEALNAERQKEYERQQKLAAAANAVRSRNPARRAQGARDLGRFGGKDFVDELIYLMQTDQNYDVRIAATRALGSLGRAARKAIPNIEGMLAQPPYDPPLVATEEQLEMQMKDGDYRKAMRDALRRIRG